MKSNETRMRFVEMRGRGLSLRKIAGELDVSVKTLCQWQRALKSQIDASTLVERESMIESFHLAETERLEKYLTLYQRVSAQVEKDYLQIVPTHHLLRMMMTLDRKIAAALILPTGGEEENQADEEEK